MYFSKYSVFLVLNPERKKREKKKVIQITYFGDKLPKIMYSIRHNSLLLKLFQYVWEMAKMFNLMCIILKWKENDT